MKDTQGNEYGHAGTEYAIEVGFDDETEGVKLAETFEDMATPFEMLQHVPGARLVQRQWAVTDWTPVPADEIEGEVQS